MRALTASTRSRNRSRSAAGWAARGLEARGAAIPALEGAIGAGASGVLRALRRVDRRERGFALGLGVGRAELGGACGRLLEGRDRIGGVASRERRASVEQCGADGEIVGAEGLRARPELGDDVGVRTAAPQLHLGGEQLRVERFA
jgi:hypothetical protein